MIPLNTRDDEVEGSLQRCRANRLGKSKVQRMPSGRTTARALPHNETQAQRYGGNVADKSFGSGQLSLKSQLKERRYVRHCRLCRHA
jgi:hypothetical protein